DKEMAHVRLILDLIFGEYNFIGTYIWKSMKGAKSNTFFTHNHTYIFTFAKDLAKFKKQRKNGGDAPVVQESILDQYPDSIETRISLHNSLGAIIPPELIRFLNPKPLELLRFLLQSWAPHPDARVLDLFAGTGSLLLATILENLEYLEHLDVRLSSGTATATRQTIGCQYPFALSDFFRIQNQGTTEFRHRCFTELTLQRLQYEFKANQWNRKTQIRVYQQILKPRTL
ncbi:MAG: hypothetical protein E4G98_05695, partial [Promethearchaeota archaeon]